MKRATDRVREYLDTKGISKYSFCKKTGFSNKFLDNSSNMGTDRASIILRHYPDLSPEWLLTGDGPMFREHVDQRASLDVKRTFPLRTDRSVERQTVPLYPIEATAGVIAVFEDVKPVPVDYLDLPDLPPVDGAVYVRGDSMSPLLKSGDIVLYKQVHDLQYGIFWGEMYLISAFIDGDVYATIKYVHKSDRDGCIKLVSHNPHHEPKDIPLEMIRAMAIVKVSVRYNTIG